ncbi:MAG: type I phosphomannose isomerase catalytic subunit [Bacteroidales bacterium]
MHSIYPLKFKPIYLDKIWGGHRIKTILGHDYGNLPNCGEAWLISGYKDMNTEVVNGFLAGNELNELVEIYMDELVGEKIYEKYENEFPILVKIIDAADWLSVQVHPDDELAIARGMRGGKTEMWYILDAEPGAQLISGFSRNTSRFEYQSLLKQKRLPEILNYETVHPGDVFFMPAGRIHALGPGVLLTEIQQTSDTTYRIYDWDRVDAQGKSRELHLEEALDAIDYNAYPEYKSRYNVIPNATSHLVKCPYFNTNLLKLDKAIEKDYGYIDSFIILVATEGICEVSTAQGTETLRAGEALLLPAITETTNFRPLVPCALLETYIDL